MNFFKQIISSTEDSSSKRFNGTIGYILSVLTIIVISIADFFKDWVLSTISEALLETTLWSAVVLLGATAVEKLWVSKPKNGSIT